MRYRIKTHQDFDKEFKRLCKKYSSLKADLSALGKSLSENPDQGTKAFARYAWPSPPKEKERAMGRE